MGGYLKPGETGGSGVFTSADGKRSVKAFYVYYDHEASVGNRDRVETPQFDERIVRALDCRGKNNEKIEPPKWLRGETTLEDDRTGKYRVTFVAGDNVWRLHPLPASEDGEPGQTST